MIANEKRSNIHACVIGMYIKGGLTGGKIKDKTASYFSALSGPQIQTPNKRRADQEQMQFFYYRARTRQDAKKIHEHMLFRV